MAKIVSLATMELNALNTLLDLLVRMLTRAYDLKAGNIPLSGNYKVSMVDMVVTIHRLTGCGLRNAKKFYEDVLETGVFSIKHDQAKEEIVKEQLGHFSVPIEDLQIMIMIKDYNRAKLLNMLLELEG